MTVIETDLPQSISIEIVLDGIEVYVVPVKKEDDDAPRIDKS